MMIPTDDARSLACGVQSMSPAANDFSTLGRYRLRNDDPPPTGREHGHFHEPIGKRFVEDAGGATLPSGILPGEEKRLHAAPFIPPASSFPYNNANSERLESTLRTMCAVMPR